ncbi:MAG: hypothetical protein AB4041_09510 [Microcystaceae cyanobacterium]
MNDLTFPAFSYLLDDSLNPSDNQSFQRLFATTLDKTEEIQIKFNSIQSLWLQGRNSETQTVQDILPLIKATQQLEQLVETYWIYFEQEDKSKLEEMADFIQKINSKGGFFSNLQKILIKPRLILEVIKLVMKSSYNIQIFLNFQSAQLSLAETILDLRDIENPNDPDIGLKFKEDVKQRLLASKKQADNGETGMSLEEVLQELELDL